jgi:cellulose synthase/poly-beta-1,6-N-acetylglucosamine synthase-like glycosyltransferase
MIESLLITLLLTYIGGLLLFVPGVLRGISIKKKRSIPESELPFITVLVCARNEENSISKCISSLVALDYPIEKIELLIVNDHSTDKTGDILTEWITKLPNLRILNTTDEDTGMHGKVNALTQGFDVATGEIVLMTDADSYVPSGWAREYVSWYDDKTGMVASITSLDGGNLFDACHSVEMVEVLALGMSGINYNVPTSIIGNNFSVRRSVYESLGGYRKVAFSVTEDLALFQAVWKSGWEVRSKSSPDFAVLTEPTPNFKTWWRQKQRWVQGGKSIGWPGHVIIGVGFIGVALLILSLFSSSLSFTMLLLAVKCAADLLILVPTLNSMGRNRLLLFLPMYQLYLLFFLLCVPIMYFQRDVKWKGRVYHS